jgi:hypothetical protein
MCTKVYKKTPQMDYELLQPCHKIFKFLSLWERTDYKILFCAHKHKSLAILSFTAGNISSVFCSTSLGILAARYCRIFCGILVFHSRTYEPYLFMCCVPWKAASSSILNEPSSSKISVTNYQTKLCYILETVHLICSCIPQPQRGIRYVFSYTAILYTLT